MISPIISNYIVSFLFTGFTRQIQSKKEQEEIEKEQFLEDECFNQMNMDFDTVHYFNHKNNSKQINIFGKKSIKGKEPYKQKIKKMAAKKKLKSQNNKIYKANNKLRILTREDRYDDKNVCILENLLDIYWVEPSQNDYWL